MAAEFKLPEKMRVRLLGLYKAQQEAIGKLPETHAYAGALTLAMDYFELDPLQHNHVNLDTGVITPPSALTKPELLKDEAAS